MPGHKNPPLTPLLQVSTKGVARGPLIDSVVLDPQKEYKVDGVLRIRNTTSTVDPQRRGVSIIAGSEESPLFHESLFFDGKDKVTIEYGSQKIVVSGSEDYAITIEVRL